MLHRARSEDRRADDRVRQNESHRRRAESLHVALHEKSNRFDLFDASLELELRPAIASVIAFAELALLRPESRKEPVVEHRVREDARAAHHDVTRDAMKVHALHQVVDELDDLGAFVHRRARDLVAARRHTPVRDVALLLQRLQRLHAVARDERVDARVVEHVDVDAIASKAFE